MPPTLKSKIPCNISIRVGNNFLLHLAKPMTYVGSKLLSKDRVLRAGKQNENEMERIMGHRGENGGKRPGT
jgi:hypothetical protein